MMKMNGDDYRKGALERLDDAFFLLRKGQLAGAVYLAGRAVEGMLRAVIWKRDINVLRGEKSLDTGHDLRRLLQTVANLGLLSSAIGRDELTTNVQRIGRLWSNNLRYSASKFVESHWLASGDVGKSRSFKQAVESFFSDCSVVIKRCELLCQK